MRRRTMLEGGAAVGVAAAGGYVGLGAYRRAIRPDPIDDLAFESRQGWDPEGVERHESPVVEWDADRASVVARGVLAVGSTDHEARLASMSFEGGTLRFVVEPHLPLGARVRNALLFFLGRTAELRIDSYEIRATLSPVPERVVVEQVDHQDDVRTGEVTP